MNENNEPNVLSAISLIQMAKAEMKNAYAPFSKFTVGAALVAESGEIYTGCNIENASYSAAICAERVAFFKAVSAGERAFRSIAIVGGTEGTILGITPPCGACLQVMSEFCDENFVVYLGDKNGYEEHTLKELLPYPFKLEM